jgi:hypothetical protein
MYLGEWKRREQEEGREKERERGSYRGEELIPITC